MFIKCDHWLQMYTTMSLPPTAPSLPILKWGFFFFFFVLQRVLFLFKACCQPSGPGQSPICTMSFDVYWVSRSLQWGCLPRGKAAALLKRLHGGFHLNEAQLWPLQWCWMVAKPRILILSHRVVYDVISSFSPVGAKMKESRPQDPLEPLGMELSAASFSWTSLCPWLRNASSCLMKGRCIC